MIHGYTFKGAMERRQGMNKNIYTSVLEHIKEGKKVCIVSRLEKLEGNVERDLRKEVVFSSSKEEVVQNSLEEKIPKYIADPKPTIVEPFYPEERLIILGGGHIAVPLVEFAAKAGFQVIVLDDRLSFANRERFPLAKEVVCDSFENGITKLQVRESDYVVIITRGHRYDSTCLKMICEGEKPSYVGMIGSRRRTAIVKDTLEQEGCSRELLDRVYTPIGLSIGAITPEEISISILAELISHKRLGEKNTERKEKRTKNSSDIDYDLMQILGEERDIHKSVITVIGTKGSTPRGAGAKMIVYRDGMIIGSIGGGCSEAAVIGEARQMVGKKAFKVMDIDLTGDAAEDEGMVCGGIMTVLIEDFITE